MHEQMFGKLVVRNILPIQVSCKFFVVILGVLFVLFDKTKVIQKQKTKKQKLMFILIMHQLADECFKSLLYILANFFLF